VNQVAPIQYAIRLLIPEGSLLLDLPEMACHLAEFDEESLCYPWAHSDPRVDQLHQDVTATVREGELNGLSRPEMFTAIRLLARRALRMDQVVADPIPQQEEVPYLTEQWYCCAEPTDLHLAAISSADTRV